MALLNNISFDIGDITRLDVDAIVNAANSSLIGGGESTEQFIAPQDRSFLQSAVLLAGAGQAKRR